MKKYRVHFDDKTAYYADVEANSIDEAHELAMEVAREGELTENEGMFPRGIELIEIEEMPS